MEVRNLDSLKSAASVDMLNALRLDLLRLKKGVVYHAGASTAVDGYADADTYVAVTNSMVASYSAHIASACDSVTGRGCHLAADATNTIAASVATNLATSLTRANELKAKANLHFVLASAHCTADSVSSVTAANATDLPTLQVLLLDIEAQLNNHFAGSLVSDAIELISA